MNSLESAHSNTARPTHTHQGGKHVRMQPVQLGAKHDGKPERGACIPESNLGKANQAENTCTPTYVSENETHITMPTATLLLISNSGKHANSP